MSIARKSLEQLLADQRKAGKSPAEIRALESVLTARREAGLKQAEVAEKMGTTQSAVARLECNLVRGKYPSMRVLEKYADAVGMKVEIRFVPK